MSESVINVNNLKSGYANTHVLFGINFEAKKDNITVVVGPNGSGKSTLLKSIFGLCSVYSGEIRYKEDTITNMEPHDISRKKIAYLPQVNNVFANLTVKENLLMASYTVNSKKISKRIPEIFETFPILEQYKNTKADTLSGGQRQMLAMDEPTASLSPKLADEVLTKIIQIREDYGITVIMVEQNIRRALKMSDYVYLLANGKNVFSGKPDELLEHPELGKMYLGVN
ncbi:MAG: ABC transporter ATP-binding protein [Nitrosopumilaceae archaeon]|nr:ABC transporter ATP-binding protein [Nitrosopumilaceae archaeon]